MNSLAATSSREPDTREESIGLMKKAKLRRRELIAFSRAKLLFLFSDGFLVIPYERLIGFHVYEFLYRLESKTNSQRWVERLSNKWQIESVQTRISIRYLAVMV